VVGGASLDTDAAFARPARLSWEALLPTEAETRAGDHLAPSEIALAALVDGLLRDGLAFITGVPTDKNGDSIDIRNENSPNLARLAEMLGEIRHTFYGSLWNVRSLGASSRNIAYTNLDLGFHMDLCYFQNPPRFQFLHMLRNRVQGGQSLFVDSFAIAEHMWTNHQDQWKVLSCTPVCFEYNNDNRHYRYTHPTFEVAMPYSGHTGPSISPGSTMPRLTAVNYAPPFQGVLPLRWPTDSSHGRTVVASPEQRRAFYSALGTFADLTHAKEYRYERTLQEGECVVFDNRRVLHSRRGFDWDQAAEKSDDDVKRWLKGCYVDGDAIWSTYRVLLAKARGGSLSNV
jgi:alpha-ketoglutarate-dependent taurine dioxygenase